MILPISIPSLFNRRRSLTQTLMAQWGGRVTPIDDRDRKLFRNILHKEKNLEFRVSCHPGGSDKGATDRIPRGPDAPDSIASLQNDSEEIKRQGPEDVSYGNSWYYLCQAANGIGPDKLGLKYFDGEMLAAIGMYKRRTLNDGWHFHIVHPVGRFDPQKILSLAKSMQKISRRPVYVKKVSSEQRDALFALGFSPIEDYPWHVQAMEEDDTFPEQTIEVAATLNQLHESSRKDLRDKYQRFVSHYGACITALDLTPANAHKPRTIVKHFFKYLEMKNLHISSPSDYDNIITHPPLGKNGKDYLSQIISINSTPAAFFAMEQISPDSAGLYANVALHQEFPYISEYLIIYCCQLLQEAGIKLLNFGGSETAGLYLFKEKFHPVSYHKMHWVVYKSDL